MVRCVCVVFQRSTNNVSQSIRDWSELEVSQYFMKIAPELSRYAEEFVRQEIDGPKLLKLNVDALCEAVMITDPRHKASVAIILKTLSLVSDPNVMA